MIQNKTQNVGFYQIALLIAIIIIVIMSIRTCKYGESSTIEFANALQDTIKTFKNKDSSQTARISVLELENVDNFFKLELADNEIVELQERVKEYEKWIKKPGSSVTNTKVTTSVSHKGKPTTYVKDNGNYTVIQEGTPVNDFLVDVSGEPKLIFPEYRDTLRNKWIYYTAKMNKDSSSFDLKVYNNFSTVIGYYKGKPYADVITDNPYSHTTSTRTFRVSMPKPKKWGLGFSVGATVGSGFKVVPYAGAGLNYNFIRF